MNLHALLVTATVLPAVLPPGNDEARKLQGTWNVTRLVGRDGKAAPPEILAGSRVVITADKLIYTLKVPGQPQEIRKESSYQLNPTTTPRAMEITDTAGPNKGKAGKAIYELDGDRLKLCGAGVGGDRPKNFEARPGSGETLIVLQREKP